MVITARLGRWAATVALLALSVNAISGGAVLSDFEAKEVPWVVSLEQSCGGALIAPTWVLTAAHCVTKHNGWNDNITIIHNCPHRNHACVHNISHRVKVAKVLPYPCFFPRLNAGVCQNSHDSALLKLSTPINITEYASISTEVVHGLEKPGFEGVVFGWGGIGKYRHGNRFDPITSHHLKSVKIAYDGVHSCLKKWSDKGIQTNLDFKGDALFCAGIGDGKGVCEGDSGGPLAARMKRKDGSIYWVVYGTVSRATPDWEAVDTHNENSGPCSAHGRYGIFTNVRYYEGWMNKVMAACDKKSDPSKCHNGKCKKKEQCWTTAIEHPKMVRRTKELNKGTMKYVEDHIVEPKVLENEKLTNEAVVTG